MFFKFVSHKCEAMTKDTLMPRMHETSFVVEAQMAKYERTIIWKKEDVPPFQHPGFENYLSACSAPPQAEDCYPLYAIVVTVFEKGESKWRPLRYYGFDGSLYVTNSQGKTIDTLRTCPVFGPHDIEKNLTKIDYDAIDAARAEQEADLDTPPENKGPQTAAGLVRDTWREQSS